MRFFLSFHNDDGAFAAKIDEAAKKQGDTANGLRLDHLLGVNVSDADVLSRRALDGYDFAIILLSDNYLNDGWFYSEVSGLASLEKKLNRRFIFTVLIDEVPTERIPLALRDKEPIDITGKKEAAGLKELMERIAEASPYLLNKVFIVHGHDEGLKESVARFLEKLGIQPIILQEELPTGKTIIENFELHADVRFALVLLTPDDVGKLNEPEEKLRLRARQNVILELGYFMGKLTRRGVCGLLKGGDIELPSDIHGIEYIPFSNDGGWKTKVAQSLKAAGYNIDMNKIL